MASNWAALAVDTTLASTPATAPARGAAAAQSAVQIINGTAGDDSLYGSKGDFQVDGGAGVDTWTFNVNFELLTSASRDPSTGVLTLQSRSQSISLQNIEFVRFRDVQVATDDPLLLVLPQVTQGPEGTLHLGTDLGYGHQGAPGQDSFQGNGGDDHLNGGLGSDTAVFRGLFSDYVLANDPTSGYVTITDQVAGRDGHDTLVSIEWLQFADGLRPMPLNARVFGTEEADFLVSKSTATDLYGMGGDDTLYGPKGGEPGAAGFRGLRSEYAVEFQLSTGILQVRDLVADRDGTDRVESMVHLRFSDSTLQVADLLDRRVTGTAADDVMRGGPGNQTLEGMQGDDRMSGDAGDDLLIGGPGDDSISGGDGEDTVQFSGLRSEYRIEFELSSATPVVIDSVAGRDGVDRILDIEWLQFADARIGLEFKRDVIGTANADDLRGGIDDQRISGGGGDDQVHGGSGEDTAVYQGPSTEYAVRLNLANGQTTITDSVWDRDGNDVVSGIEWLQFSDGTFSFESLVQEVGTRPDFGFGVPASSAAEDTEAPDPASVPAPFQPAAPVHSDAEWLQLAGVVSSPRTGDLAACDHL